ncbi:MAG TPA: DUF2142 domain-containing protein [Pseudolysinimonas sp.]|jgi:hypothetical protein
MAPRRSSFPLRRFPLLLLAPILAVIALVAWGYGSPVGSSPDDDFHLASIWCGGASLSATCEPGAKADERTVPKDLLVQAVCFAHDGNASGACQGKNFGVHPDVVATSDRVNATGLYPPVFYFVTSVFAGPNVDVSVLAIRIFNSILFVGWIVLLWFLLPARRRPGLVIGVVVTAVPLGMSIVPSTNPSSWAILSAATLWLALVGYFESSGRRKIALGAFAVVAAVIGAGARSDSAVYSALAVVVAVILTARRDRAYLLSSLLGLAVIAMSIAFYFSGHQADVASTGFSGEGAHPSRLSSVALFGANTLLIPGLWSGIFGLEDWQLGWLDAPVPALTAIGAFLVFCGALFLGLRVGSRRKWLAVGLVVLAMWLIPTTILVLSRSVVGSYVQPRYILPLIVMLAGLALFGLAPRITASRAQRILAIVALSAANAIGLAFYMRRYITGVDQGGIDLDTGAEWWWPQFWLSPMAVLVIGSLAFAGMLVVLDRRLFTRASRADPHAVDQAPAITDRVLTE